MLQRVKLAWTATSLIVAIKIPISIWIYFYWQTILPLDNDRILFLINLLSFIKIYICIRISKPEKKILSLCTVPLPWLIRTYTYEPFNSKAIQVKKVDHWTMRDKVNILRWTERTILARSANSIGELTNIYLRRFSTKQNETYSFEMWCWIKWAKNWLISILH